MVESISMPVPALVCVEVIATLPVEVSPPVAPTSTVVPDSVMPAADSVLDRSTEPAFDVSVNVPPNAFAFAVIPPPFVTDMLLTFVNVATLNTPPLPELFNVMLLLSVAPNVPVSDPTLFDDAR